METAEEEIGEVAESMEEMISVERKGKSSKGRTEQGRSKRTTWLPGEGHRAEGIFCSRYDWPKLVTGYYTNSVVGEVLFQGALPNITYRTKPRINPLRPMTKGEKNRQTTIAERTATIPSPPSSCFVLSAVYALFARRLHTLSHHGRRHHLLRCAGGVAHRLGARDQEGL